MATKKRTAWTKASKARACEEILRRMTEENISLRSILPPGRSNGKLPSRGVFYTWLQADKELLDRYTSACEVRADHIFEEILDIADDSSKDEVESEDGRVSFNAEFARRSQIRIDARKWILGKMRPNVYGDRQRIDLNDESRVKEMSKEEVLAELKARKLIK